MYLVWHTLVVYKYQLSVMLVIIVMLCVSISKTKGQKWKENKGPLLDRGSGKV
jgi:hypothetical protein